MRYLIEDQLLHERLIEIINSTFDSKKKEICLDLLVTLVRIYKDQSYEDKYISLELLEKLTNHSKVFCQLLYFYRN